jgi:hypothetical protein
MQICVNGVARRRDLLVSQQRNCSGNVGDPDEIAQHRIGVAVGGRRWLAAGPIAVRRTGEIQRNDALGLHEVPHRGENVGASASGEIRRGLGDNRLADDKRPRKEQPRRKR